MALCASLYDEVVMSLIKVDPSSALGQIVAVAHRCAALPTQPPRPRAALGDKGDGASANLQPEHWYITPDDDDMMAGEQDTLDAFVAQMRGILGETLEISAAACTKKISSKRAPC